MANRNKILKKSLKYIQSPTGGSNNIPPEGSVLANYLDYVTGATQVSYPRGDESKPGTLPLVAIAPFADPSLIIRVKASARALTTMESGIRTACNIDQDATNVQNANPAPRGFIPAKVTIFRPDVAGEANSSSAPVTSQITGIRYDPRDGNNFTLPFGQPGTATTLSAVQSGIKTAVLGAGVARSTSFQPEVWR